jgi:hypothetical protein
VTDAPKWDFWHGVFYNRSKESFRDIQDGASNSMLFGENTGGEGSNIGGGPYSFSWIGCGALGTAWGLDGDGWYQYNSDHPGIVQFCFADGAVHQVSEQTDLDTVMALSGIQDGEVANLGP